MRTRFIPILIGLLFGVSNLNGQSIKSTAFEKLISFQLGIGQSYYTFEGSDNELISSHNDKWRSANNYSALIGFHPNPKWMLSLTGSYHFSEARTDGVIAAGQGVVYSGYLLDRVQLLSIGINAEQTVFKLKAVDLSYHVGVNLFYLENNGTLIVDDFKLSGTDFGFRIGVNGDWFITNKMSLIAQIQYSVNTIGDPNYEVDDPKIPVIIPSQDMSRVELNIGLRYSFLRKTRRKKQERPKEDEDEYVPNKRFE